MVVRIIGTDQVVKDCRSGTPDKYLAKLLVGITESKNQVTVPVIRSNYYFSTRYEVTSRPAIESGHDSYAPTERGILARRECPGLWS